MARIALFGATGMIGSRILAEARTRGHEVSAISKDAANVLRAAGVARVAQGQDVVISAFGPGGGSPELLVDAANALVEGVRGSGARLLVVGGAGSLLVAPGKQLVDTPNFPDAWKGIAKAHTEALEIFRAAKDVNWTVLAPSALIEPGTRTGHYRTAIDQLITDAHGNSRISAEDYAVAMLDEIEHPKFERRRFTAGY